MLIINVLKIESYYFLFLSNNSVNKIVLLKYTPKTTYPINIGLFYNKKLVNYCPVFQMLVFVSKKLYRIHMKKATKMTVKKS